MRPRRRTALLATVVTTAALAVAVTGGAAVAAPTAPGGAGGAGADPAAPAAAVDGVVTEYVVLYRASRSDAAARTAIARAGGTVVRENAGVGYAVARSTRADFADRVNASGAVEGAARNRVIGSSTPLRAADADEIEAATADGARGPAVVDAPAAAAAAGPTTAEPFAGRQWDMRQIGATPTGSYATDPGRRSVLVGVIDTGVDGSHPDIAPNFDVARSRNFTTDIPSIDGPCEVASCVDAADVDDRGHGTHVASTIASPANGLGIAGVAPTVTLVNLRAGQDSGYFFLQATLDALTYAGDIGVDVVNMSFYIDPWLYNCLANPADSAAEQTEQRIVRNATQRAVTYARDRGVLPIAAEGNQATDLGNPTSDTSSPDFPPGSERSRAVDNSCLSVPTETGGVVSISSTGPSKRKAYYSNYGTEQTDLAAPGGDGFDTADGTRDNRATVLAAYPRHVIEAAGYLNPDGTPNQTFVLRDCKGTVCGYYEYLQGTSMAAPHAAGVAALIVGRFGTRDTVHGGLTLAPSTTEQYLTASATPTRCPNPRTYTYTRVLAPGQVTTSTATCAGSVTKNGFYGRGIVNAAAAVTLPPAQG